MLVGNKCDVENSSADLMTPRSSKQYRNYLDLEITQREHHQIAREYGIPLVARVSARTGHGVHRMFNGLIGIIQRQREMQSRIDSAENKVLNYSLCNRN